MAQLYKHLNHVRKWRTRELPYKFDLKKSQVEYPLIIFSHLWSWYFNEDKQPSLDLGERILNSKNYLSDTFIHADTSVKFEL